MPNNLPTPAEVKEFSKKFTQTEWLKLCGFRYFMEIVMEDLHAAGIAAEMMLAGKWDRERFDRKLKIARRKVKVK